MRIIHHDRNQGLACARNSGALAAKGLYIIFLDPDDLLDPMALEKLLIFGLSVIGQPVPHFHDAYYGFVYSGVRHFGDMDQISYADYNPAKLLKDNYLTSTALIPRKLYLQIGGNCPRSILDYFEDYDFWLRMLSLGYHGKLLHEPLFLYRRHDTGQSKSLIQGVSDHEWKREARQHNPIAYGDLPKSTVCKMLNARDAQSEVFPCYGSIRTTSSASFWSDWLFAKSPSIQPVQWCQEIDLVSKSFTLKSLSQSSKTQLQQSHEEKIRVLYLIPWMVMGGADLYDLQVLESLSQSMKYHITLVVARHIPVHPWEARFRPLVHEIFHLQRLTNDSRIEEDILDYLMDSRNIKMVINSRTIAGYQSFKRWQSNPHIKKVDILHLHEPASRSGWEWRAGQIGSIIDRRIVVSQNLKVC